MSVVLTRVFYRVNTTQMPDDTLVNADQYVHKVAKYVVVFIYF